MYLQVLVISINCNFTTMKIIQIYKCLCDEMRIRILNLLKEGPLCVCHLLEVLDCDPVKLSKQLRYMKELGMVRGKRQAQWIVYSLAEPANPLLRKNLQCLQDCAGEDLSLQRDRKKRTAVVKRICSSKNPLSGLGGRSQRRASR